jgi:hypothetical protein
MWMQLKLEMLHVVAKWGGSEPVDATFNCFSFATLDSLRVFPMAFTSSARCFDAEFLKFSPPGSCSDCVCCALRIPEGP